MRVRHRIPSIFNLSMVDVLCCALGCVILLWLFFMREADEEQRAHGLELTRLQDDRKRVTHDLDEAIYERDTLRKLRESLKRDLAAEEAARLELDRKLREALAKILDLDKDLGASKARGEGLMKDLDASKNRGEKIKIEADELAKKLADALKRIAALEAIAAKLPAMEKTADKKEQDLTKLNELLKSVLAEKTKVEKDLKDKDKDLVLALGAKRKAEQEIDAWKDKSGKLEAVAKHLQAEVDNRFAGIALTGRRVVFLVDMSGSMERVDPDTLAPTKWSDVRATLCRVMRSLQNLEKYQVILFSDKVSYLLGNEDTWITYDPATTIDAVEKAMAATTPKGGTNMFLALETAFKLRPSGLDTIYLLSDGLPNMGPGLTTAEAQRLRGRAHEVEKGNLLGRHILKVLRTDWNRTQKVKINSVGFFYESPDVGAFLWSLSRANGGSFVGMSSP